jgi:hypothetical protein
LFIFISLLLPMILLVLCFRFSNVMGVFITYNRLILLTPRLPSRQIITIFRWSSRLFAPDPNTCLVTRVEMCCDRMCWCSTTGAGIPHVPRSNRTGVISWHNSTIPELFQCLLCRFSRWFDEFLNSPYALTLKLVVIEIGVSCWSCVWFLVLIP